MLMKEVSYYLSHRLSLFSLETYIHDAHLTATVHNLSLNPNYRERILLDDHLHLDTRNGFGVSHHTVRVPLSALKR
jgi:hypothetical protein